MLVWRVRFPLTSVDLWLILLHILMSAVVYRASLVWRFDAIRVQRGSIPECEYSWIFELNTSFSRLCTIDHRC
ncbi:hypothetical protein ACOSP7_016261 [Xanthoceras sorbifolium]